MNDYFKLTDNIVISNLKQILAVSIEREEQNDFLVIYYKNRIEPLKLKINSKSEINLVELLLSEIEKRKIHENEIMEKHIKETRERGRNSFF